MIKVVIVDDEAPARRLLRKMLTEPGVRDIEVVAECSDGRSASETIKARRPDVVFLDVQMPEMDGFEVLERLSGERLPYIIFVTAYDEYAVRAFDAHALDYLLKPFSNSRFADCLERMRETIRRDLREVEIAKGLSLAQSNAERGNDKSVDALGAGRVESLQVRDGAKVELLEFADVLWFGAASQYVDAHTAEKSYLLSESMNSLQGKLDPQKFFRIHRSAIVNVSFIAEIRNAGNGAFAIVLKDGSRLTLSRRRRELLGELLKRRKVESGE